MLRAQPSERQHQTMQTSRAELEAALGIDVADFAYPFGGHDAFDTTTVADARAIGFTTATTTVPGSVGRTPDPYTLRRRMVMDWAPNRFRGQMLRWGILETARHGDADRHPQVLVRVIWVHPITTATRSSGARS